MKPIKTVLTIGALGFSLINTWAWAEGNGTPAVSATPAQPAKPSRDESTDIRAIPAKPATPAVPPAPRHRAQGLPQVDDEDAAPSTPATPAVPAETGDNESGVQPGVPVVPAGLPSKHAFSISNNEGIVELTKPSPSGMPEVSTEVKKAIDDAKKVRTDFLKKQQELRGELRNATKEDRARIREDMDKARDEFLAAQRQTRQELKKRVVELKEQLRFHQDAINDAKEEAKSKNHPRKEG